MNYLLNTLFDKNCISFSFNIAVEDVLGNQITYAQLYEKVGNIQGILKSNHINAGNRIGILSSKNSDCIPIIFSVLKQQCAYVPLDIKSPADRLNTIIDECDLKAIFIETEYLETVLYKSLVATNYKVLPISDLISLIIFHKKTTLHSEALAYILFTSGSTGVPKGVMHTHKSAVTFIKWSVKKFNPKQVEKFGSFAPFHFDLSIFDLFVPMCVGATLVVFNESTTANPLLLASNLENYKINYFYATPSALIYLLNFGKLDKYKFNALKTILFAGEVFPIAQLRKLIQQLPNTSFYNLYGPTETNVCTYFKIPKYIAKTQTHPYPIGKACSFSKLFINEHNELYVSGNSLMVGYWNDLFKSSNAFYEDEKGIKWYKTGDLVSVDSNNNIVYIGRKDRMVKRNSFRIELGEVEFLISKNPAVLQVAVTANSFNAQTDVVLTAHIVINIGYKINEVQLFRYCAEKMLTYMIPDSFKIHEKLPITSTLKIDYKKLSLLHD